VPKRKKKETFGDRLRSLRQARGLTMYALWQLSIKRGHEVSKQTISRLEAKQEPAQPTWETVQALARALDVPTDAFVIREPQEPAPAPEQRHQAEPPKARTTRTTGRKQS
jgi:transcriptional regulator with XRE-family HTH domain